MSKKILIVSHGASLCGAEQSLLLLLAHMNRDRFEPLVVLPRTGPLEEALERMAIPTRRIWYPWWVRTKSDTRGLLRYLTQEMKAAIKLCAIIRQENIDLVYTNTSVVCSGAVAAFLTRRPHVWHIREILPNNPDLVPILPLRLTLRLIRAFSTALIANSHATARQFGQSHIARDFHVIYNAQPLEGQETPEHPLELDDVDEDDWLVACVGTLQTIKAPDDAIRAIAVARKTIPRIRLLLIGDGPSEFKESLIALSQELGVSDRVTFTGFRTDVPRILSHSQVLIMPSWNESFGRVLIEAMAVGIPVIGANAGGIGEVIEDGSTGYLVAPRVPEELAERLVRLHQNPGIAKAMSAAGQRMVAARFNVDTYVGSVEQVLAETQGNGDQAGARRQMGRSTDEPAQANAAASRKY